MTARVYDTLVMIALTLGAASTASGAAPPRHATPAALASAKTIYLENQAGSPKAVDELARRVRRWGRLKVVDAKGKADVVASVTTEAFPVGRPAPPRPGASTTSRRLTLTVRRVNTGDLLWSDSDSSLETLVAKLRSQLEPPPKICIAVWCR